MIVMKGGFFSIPLRKLSQIKISEPTIFNTIPFGLNFFSENSFMIPSKKFHSKLIDLGIHGKLKISDEIIGIDKNTYLKFFEHKDLSPIRTALALNTPIKYCFHQINKMSQLSKARASINLKFRNLSKSLKTKITNDKVIKSYIRLLTSFEKYCSKEDYVFYCMVNYPDKYLDAISMEPFLMNLMEVDPNENEFN